MAVLSFSILFLICLAIITPTSCLTELDLFPHKESEGSIRIQYTSDVTRTVSFTSPFTLFNKTHRSIIIHSDGVVGFGSGGMQNTPDCSTTPQPHQRIMVFWSDGVEANRARLTYSETSSSPFLQKATRDITKAFPVFNTRPLNLSSLFIVTWINSRECCPSPDPTKENTFQLVLASSESHSFVLLYYVKTQWYKNNKWAAGFNFGDGRLQYRIAGSCTSDFESISTTSNVGEPGKWVFGVDLLDLKLPGARYENYDVEDMLLLIQPYIVSVMGNVPIIINGPVLTKQDNVNITCIFQDPSRAKPSETIGTQIISIFERVIVCPVPFLYSLGRIEVSLRVKFPSTTTAKSITSMYQGHIYVVREHEMDPLPEIYFNRTLENSLLLSANWNPSSVTLEDIQRRDSSANGSVCDSRPFIETVEIVLLEYKHNVWKELGPLTPPILNNGIHLSPFNTTVFNDLTNSGGDKPYLRTLALKAKYRLKSGATVKKLLAASSLIVTDSIIFGQRTVKLVETNHANRNGNMYDGICKSWFEKEPCPPNSLDTVPCPRRVEQAQNDWRFDLDNSPEASLQIFSPGVFSSYIQKVPSVSGAASQCNYDEQGNLVLSMPGAGRLLRHSPNNIKDHWRHYSQDILPYLYCCRWSARKVSNCVSYYYRKRPLNSGRNYAPPLPSRAIGLSHVSTFDGTTFTLIGARALWMIKYSSADSDIDGMPVYDDDTINEFKLQVKVEPFQSVRSKRKQNASMITEAVMEDRINEKEVKVKVSSQPTHISVMVDGQFINGIGYDNDLANLYLYRGDGVMITFQTRTHVVATFLSGFSILFVSHGRDDHSLNIVATASPHMLDRREGLFGRFGGESIVKESESLFSDLNVSYYADSINQTEFPPIVLQPEMNASVSLKLGDQICNGYPECDSDYSVARSRRMADAGMESYSIYDQVLKVTKAVLNNCELPNKLENGHFIVSSLTIGSIIKVSCDTGYVATPNLADETFVCKNYDGAGESAKWVNANSGEVMLSFYCIPQNAKALVTEKYCNCSGLWENNFIQNNSINIRELLID